MVNLMDAVKGPGSAKASQAQKSKKSSSNEQSAFGQALTEAAGAANSASAQPERQNYEQNEAAAAEKGTENVQAASESPVQQTVLVPEGMEGQDALAGLMKMDAEGGIQPGGMAEAAAGSGMAEVMQETVQESGLVQTAETVQTAADTGKIPLDTVQSVVSAEESPVNAEDFTADLSDASGQTGSEGLTQMASSDMGKGAKALDSTQDEENSIIDVRAEAAADKASTSFMQLQSSNDSGVVEAQVEVTGSGEIKPEYENMLKDMIAKQISSGRQEFEIALTPKNLGTLLVKVAVEAGETTVSIICTNARTMQAMSSKASELGKMLETTLGEKMDVVVEDKNGQESHLYEEGRNDSGAQAQKEEQERRHEDARRKLSREADSADFLQQLRLGLA